MREILFRGKRKDNGEWIEGSAINTQYDVKGNKHIYIGVFKTSEGYPLMKFIEWFEVVSETVGQYTGLTDKNGKKIFEGDIVKHYNNSDDVFDIGTVYWDETFLQWKRTSIGNFHHSSFTYVMSRSCEYEVIGNIHDKPELLGCKADADKT